MLLFSYATWCVFLRSLTSPRGALWKTAAPKTLSAYGRSLLLSITPRASTVRAQPTREDILLADVVQEQLLRYSEKAHMLCTKECSRDVKVAAYNAILQEQG